MRENIQVLNAFKDGQLVRLGKQSTQLQLQIYAPFLFPMLKQQGQSFFVLMSGCKGHQFLSFADNDYIVDASKILGLQPIIIDALEFGQAAHINCSTGKLEVIYDHLEIRLESGARLDYSVLQAASTAYWSQFDDPGFLV